jgi:DNA-binding GntR family transcriptional regulator
MFYTFETQLAKAPNSTMDEVTLLYASPHAEVNCEPSTMGIGQKIPWRGPIKRRLRMASLGRIDQPLTSAPNNRTTEVYEQLRQAIVDGSIRPNERLIEIDLAERLGVSRTPVRETMLRLAGDGLIVSQRRGWVVREHSADEIREVYEVRAALEGFAAGLAAQRATDAELNTIEGIHQSYVDLIQDSSRGTLVEHNDAFHEAIIAAARNRLLTDQIHRNSQYYFIHRIAGFLSNEEVRISIEGHEELVRALMVRDPILSEQVARSRVFEGLEKVLNRIR